MGTAPNGNADQAEAVAFFNAIVSAQVATFSACGPFDDFYCTGQIGTAGAFKSISYGVSYDGTNGWRSEIFLFVDHAGGHFRFFTPSAVTGLYACCGTVTTWDMDGTFDAWAVDANTATIAVIGNKCCYDTGTNLCRLNAADQCPGTGVCA